MAAITVHRDSGAQENKICHCFHFFPFCLRWNNRTRCHDLSVLNLEFQTSFFSLLFSSSKGSLVPLLSAVRVVSSAYLRLLLFLLAVSDSSWCILPGVLCSTFQPLWKMPLWIRMCTYLFETVLSVLWGCKQKRHCSIVYCYSLKVDMDGCPGVFSCPSE